MTRHIDFEGIENFRDFGGYGTECGRGVRRGLLYRSANHHYATDTDLERMRTWDNGNNHIWSVSLAPWLDAHRAM